MVVGRYYYIISCFIGITLFILGSCSHDPVAFEPYIRLSQSQNEPESPALVAEPITPRKAKIFPHLMPYVGYLLIGNELSQWIVPGIPSLPYDGQDHPLILKAFQKVNTQWLALNQIPEVRIQIQGTNRPDLQPIALSQETTKEYAKLEVRYGNVDSFKKSELLIKFLINPNENRLKVIWEVDALADQGDTAAARVKKPKTSLIEKNLSYQVNLKVAAMSTQELRFKHSGGKLLKFEHGLDTIALIFDKTWQAATQDLETVLTQTMTPGQQQEIDFSLGRFGLFAATYQYDQPSCQPNSGANPCLWMPSQIPLKPIRVQIEGIKRGQPSLSRLNHLLVQSERFEPNLMIPVQEGESFDLQIPEDIVLALLPTADPSGSLVKPHLETKSESSDFTGDIYTFADQRSFQKISILPPQQNLPAPLWLYFKSHGSWVPLSFRYDDRQELAIHGFSSLPPQALNKEIWMEQGSYELMISHPFGLVCGEILEVRDKEQKPRTLPCLQDDHLQLKLKPIVALTKDIETHFVEPETTLIGTIKELELTPLKPDQQNLADQPESYVFFDPKSSVKIQVYPLESNLNLVEQWQRYSRRHRSPSIYILKQFLDEYAPQSIIALGCPLQKIPAHDYLSYAKALNGREFGVLGCHDLSYENRLIEAIDHYQSQSRHSLGLRIGWLPDQFGPNRVVRPFYIGKRTQEHPTIKNQTIGSGAIISILQVDGTSPAILQKQSAAEPAKVKLVAGLNTLVLSEIYQDPEVRIIAIDRNRSPYIVTSQAIKALEVQSLKFDLELSATTRYLRAEIFAKSPFESGRLAKIRLATSQYTPIALPSIHGEKLAP